MCVAIFGDIVSMSLLYLFDFLSQLKNWLRVQGVAPNLYFFWETCFSVNLFPFVVPRSQLQECRSLLNLFLLDASGFPAGFSISMPRHASFSRTWEVDAASNEFGSTLILLSVFTEAIGIPGFLGAIGLDAVEELVALEEDSWAAFSSIFYQFLPSWISMKFVSWFW